MRTYVSRWFHLIVSCKTTRWPDDQPTVNTTGAVKTKGHTAQLAMDARWPLVSWGRISLTA
jgi:hypothetical protein